MILKKKNPELDNGFLVSWHEHDVRYTTSKQNTSIFCFTSNIKLLLYCWL